MDNINNYLELIESYIDENTNNEINIYSYKGINIYENYYGENEFTINDYWYQSLDDAIRSIEKINIYNNLSKEYKQFVDNYNKRNFCQKLEDLCPYDNECKKCILHKTYLLVKQKANNDKEFYHKIMKDT